MKNKIKKDENNSEKPEKGHRYSWVNYYVPEWFEGLAPCYNPKRQVKYFRQESNGEPEWTGGFYFLNEAREFPEFDQMLMGQSELHEFLNLANQNGYMVYPGWGIRKSDFEKW